MESFWENGFIVLEEVLDRAEITAYGEAIRDVAMAHFRARGLALSFGGAFLQQLNLRYCSDAVRSFVQSPRFGRIASRLLRASAVRLYHEQALFKPPGGTDSHWHQSRESTLTPRIVDRPVGDQVGVLRCCTSDSWLNTKTLADLLIYGDVLASFDCYRDAVSDRTIE